MLSLDSAYTAHAAQETTDFCTLWRITRADAAVYRFTDHDRDLEMPGDGRYLAASGYTASASANKAGLAADAIDLAAVFDSSAITEADLLAGLWDGATVEVMSAIWSAPSAGTRMIRKGRLGQVTYDGVRFNAELTELRDLLNTQVGRIYSATCDANFGDARCGLSTTPHTRTFTVTAVTDRKTFVADMSADTADDWATGGLLTWSTGANAGRSMEVKRNTGSPSPADIENVVLSLPMLDDIAVGDTGSIVAGCNKTYAACRDTFNNTVNFRGWPHLPGIDRVIAVVPSR